MNPRWFLMLPLAAGVVFLGVGVSLFTDDGPAKELQRVEALPRVTGGPLEQVGDVVLVQGRLARSNRPVYRNFLACARALFAGYEQDPPNQPTPVGVTPQPHQHEKWTARDVLTPALTLELDGGTVQLSASYQLTRPLHHMADPVDVDLLTARPEALDGFFVGDVVTAQGRIGPGQTLVTSSVEGGDLEAFIAARKTSAIASHVLGLVFMPVGAFLLLLTGFITWRVARAGAPKHAPR